MIARKHGKGTYTRRTPEQVVAIRAMLEIGISQAEVARVFGCSPSTISEIARGLAHAAPIPVYDPKVVEE